MLNSSHYLAQKTPSPCGVISNNPCWKIKISPPCYFCFYPRWLLRVNFQKGCQGSGSLWDTVRFILLSCILSATFTVQSHTWLSGVSLWTYRCRQQRQVGGKTANTKHQCTPEHQSLTLFCFLAKNLTTVLQRHTIHEIKLNWGKAVIYVFEYMWAS